MSIIQKILNNSKKGVQYYQREPTPDQTIIIRTNDPIRAMENPRALIEHKSVALKENLGEVAKEGKIILPAVKINNTK